MLNHKDILGKTVQTNIGELIQLSYTLPGGEVITSDKLKRSSLKGSVLITWCDAILGKIKQDSATNTPEQEASRQARIKREGGGNGIFNDIAAREALGEGQPSLDIPLRPPESLSKETSPKSNSNVPVLSPAHLQEAIWSDYGLAMARVEQLKAKLRATGEKI